jgi:hypothetical protein
LRTADSDGSWITIGIVCCDDCRQGFEQLEYVFKTASDLENENENLRKELQETRGKSIKS